jgi:hypothetical protein
MFSPLRRGVEEGFWVEEMTEGERKEVGSGEVEGGEVLCRLVGED